MTTPNQDGWYTTRPFNQDPEEFLNKLSYESEKDNATPLNWVESMAVVSAIRCVILHHLPAPYSMSSADFNNYECNIFCAENDHGSAEPEDIERLITTRALHQEEWREEFTLLFGRDSIRTKRCWGYVYMDVWWGGESGWPSGIPLYLRLVAAP